MSNKSKRQIKVAMIIQEYLPMLGGAQRQIAALNRLFPSLGIDIHVITRRNKGLTSYEVIDGVPVYRLPITRSKIINSILYSINSIRLLYKIKPDVVHAHGLLSPMTTGVFAKKLLKIPVVVKSLRGGELGDLKRLLNRFLGNQRFRWLQKQVDKFIVISTEIMKELIDKGVKTENCLFIPNGVDTSRYVSLSRAGKQALKNELKLPKGPIVLYVGRLEPEKRIYELIELWPLVQKNFPKALLYIIGEGREYIKLVNKAGPGVVFTGAINDVLPYYQVADLFVLPSISEGLSNSLLEALSVELPVVVTATGGTIDIVIHKKTGLLINDFSKNDFASGVVEMLSNSTLSRQCGRAGREFVKSKYSLTATANDLTHLYNEVLVTPKQRKVR